MSDAMVPRTLDAEAIRSLERQIGTYMSDDPGLELLSVWASRILAKEIKCNTIGPLMIFIMIAKESKAINQQQAAALSDMMIEIGVREFSGEGICDLYKSSAIEMRMVEAGPGNQFCLPTLVFPTGIAISDPHVVDFVALFNRIFAWPHAVSLGSTTRMVPRGLTKRDVYEIFST